MTSWTRRLDYRAWGGTLNAAHLVARPQWPDEARAAVAGGVGHRVLAYGCGRSYGDVGLNPDGRLVDCGGLDRFIAFDPETGILDCEAGVRLADILACVTRPASDGSAWFLPVSPGTRFVSVGGAIANDVHGKNHHGQGCFGNHVLSFDLARSDGSVTACSRDTHPALFAATIGGLGLTGLILRARLQLRAVAGTALEIEDIRLASLEAFFEHADGPAADWEYTAAWIDCAAAGPSLGRGIFTQARHHPGSRSMPPAAAAAFAVPLTPPASPLRPWLLRLFNACYYRWQGRHNGQRRVGPYVPVLYPLDAVGAWNWLYGRRGFFQFQCVVPPPAARDSVKAMLSRIAASGEGSMLGVLKTFGERASPGLLSFPMPGTTLALDFPDRGPATRRLLAVLEDIVVEAGGRLYPAKDALMRGDSFRHGYPGLAAFLPHLDPGFSSAFARRVGIA